MAPLFAGEDLVFNKSGLLNDEQIAGRTAAIFSNDPATKSHGPFYAVRVWVQGFSSGSNNQPVNAKLQIR